MPPPPKHRFSREFDVDLNSELGLDNPYSSRGVSKTALVIVGICVCLVVGVAIVKIDYVT